MKSKAAARMREQATVALCGVLACWPTGLGAGEPADWPCFRGPGRNGISAETHLADTWPEKGPPLVWKTRLETGLSGPVVAGERVFVLGRKNNYWYGRMPTKEDKGTNTHPEVLYCLNRRSGRLLWKHEIPLTWRPAPHAVDSATYITPTVDEDRVYVRSAFGEVRCLFVEDGAQVWAWPEDKELLRVQGPLSGSCFQPGPGYLPCHLSTVLVEGELAIFHEWCDKKGSVIPRKTNGLVALDKKTGRLRWRCESEVLYPTFDNPVVMELRGRRLLARWNRIIDLKTGKELCHWGLQTHYPGGCGRHLSYVWTLGFSGNRVVTGFRDKPVTTQEASAEKGPDRGAACIELNVDASGQVSSKQLWKHGGKDGKLDKAFVGPLIVGDCAYVWMEYYRCGHIACLDLATGKEMWHADGLPKGLKVKVDAAEIDKDKAEARYVKKWSGGANWAQPVYADGKIYLLDSGGRLTMFAADPRQYRVLDCAQITAPTWSAPALSGGHLFTHDQEGWTRCFDLRGLSREGRQP